MPISNSTDRFNGVIASLAVKVRCVVGAEANVATLAGAQTIESIPVALGDRVLLTAQTDPIENGAWDVQNPGPWTRAADWDGNRDVEKGSTVWAGKTGQDDQLWQVQTAGVIVPGNTAQSITLLFNPASPTSSNLQDVTDIGAVTTNTIQLNGGSLLIVESTLQPDASVATIGQVWVRDDAPNVLMFTDDLGGDYQLSSVAGVLPVGTIDDSPLVWVDPAWVENTGVRLGANNIKILESAAGAADTATYGQFWVRDDAAQTPMFTDDAGLDTELNAAGGGTVDTFNYQFDTTLSGTTTAGQIRLDAANPALAGLFFINATDADGNDLTADLNRLDYAKVLTVRQVDDPTKFLKYSVRSDPSKISGQYVPSISLIEVGTLPDNNAAISVELGASPYFGNFSNLTLSGAIPIYNSVTGRFDTLSDDFRFIASGGIAQLRSGGSNNLELQSNFRVQIRQPFYIGEQGANSGAPAAFGSIWVRNDAPNVLMFTNDVGTDFRLDQIGAQASYTSSFVWGSGSTSTASSGSSRTVQSGATFEFDDNATLDFGTGNDVKLSFDGTDFNVAGIGGFNVTGFTDMVINARIVPDAITNPTESVAATNVITAAESGKTFFLNAAGGFTSTLPVPAAGLKYTFIVATAPTTAYIITTNAGANILEGTFLDIVGELQAISAQDTLNFVASTSLVGDRLEVESDGTSWFCTAFSKADGGITVSVT